MDSLTIDETGMVVFPEGPKAVKISSKSILEVMRKNIAVPEGVMLRAENIYVSIGSPVKKNKKDNGGDCIGKNKRELIFFCLHAAYADLDIIHSLKKLAFLVGLESDRAMTCNISRIINKYSINKTGYHMIQRFYSLNEYVKFFVETIHYDASILEHATYIIECIETANHKFDSPPDVAAMAIILYVNNNFMPKINNCSTISKKGKWPKVELYDALAEYIFETPDKINNFTDTYITNNKLIRKYKKLKK